MARGMISGHYNTFAQPSERDGDTFLDAYLDDLVHPPSGGNPDIRSRGFCGPRTQSAVKVCKLLLLLGLSLAVACAGWIKSNTSASGSDATNEEQMPRDKELAMRASAMQPVEWLEAAAVSNGRASEGSFSADKFNCLFAASRYHVIKKVCRHSAEPSDTTLISQSTAGMSDRGAAMITELAAHKRNSDACHNRYFVHVGDGDVDTLDPYAVLVQQAPGQGQYQAFDTFADAVFGQHDLAIAHGMLQPTTEERYDLYIGLDVGAKARWAGRAQKTSVEGLELGLCEETRLQGRLQRRLAQRMGQDQPPLLRGR